MTWGKVVTPGPDRNSETTTSSNDKVNVSSQAASSACEMLGKVTRKNTWLGLQPKSMAASSMERSISFRRDWITTAA